MDKPERMHYLQLIMMNGVTYIHLISYTLTWPLNIYATTLQTRCNIVIPLYVSKLNNEFKISILPTSIVNIECGVPI